ncbi:hypothetical protein, partial [Streptomyces sp. NPDC091278]
EPESVTTETSPALPAWTDIPLETRQTLAVAAYALTTPERAPLTDREHRPALRALRALAGRRQTPAQLRLLLTTPRTSLGGPASTRADTMHTLLTQLATDLGLPPA